MNLHLDLVDQAEKNNWCMKRFCTTCGARNFRNALQHLLENNEEEYYKDLEKIDLAELERRKGWCDSLLLVLNELTNTELKDKVLVSWIDQLDNHIRLADIVLFYCIRKGSLFASISKETRLRWINKCIDIANKVKDESLIESLIYTMRNHYKENASLVGIIDEMSATSKKIKLAIKNID